MSRVLYIQASPRKNRSHSIAVADAFIECYRRKNTADEIIKVNLFDMQLPPFDGLTVQAKYSIIHGQSHSKEEAAVWREVEKSIDFFKAADKYVLAVPMWNFGIPYRLKHYLDVLIQPTYTFAATDSGYKGLLAGKKAFIVYARGGEYSGAAASYDYQKPYLESALAFMGITDICSLTVEPTLAGPERAAETRNNALAEVPRLAASF